MDLPVHSDSVVFWSPNPADVLGRHADVGGGYQDGWSGVTLARDPCLGCLWFHFCGLGLGLGLGARLEFWLGKPTPHFAIRLHLVQCCGHCKIRFLPCVFIQPRRSIRYRPQPVPRPYHTFFPSRHTRAVILVRRAVALVQPPLDAVVTRTSPKPRLRTERLGTVPRLPADPQHQRSEQPYRVDTFLVDRR
jgi:hypothetical protein